MNVSERRNLTGMTRFELVEFMDQFGGPRYRADQVFRGIHQRRLQSFDEMTDVPKQLREKLNEAATPSTLTTSSTCLTSPSVASRRSACKRTAAPESATTS